MRARSALRHLAMAVVVPGAAALTVAVTAAPALAAPPDSYSSRTSGERAYASWTETDLADSLRLPGNTHVGHLYVDDGAYGYTYGQIEDWQCAPGQVPGWGHGGHGDDAGACELVQVRGLEAGTTDLVVNGKSGTARLTGTLVVTNGGHGEPGAVLATPRVDMTWTSGGRMATYSRTETSSYSGYTYRSQVRGASSTGETSVKGAIGAMGFADDVDDAAAGGFDTFRETSRQRIR